MKDRLIGKTPGELKDIAAQLGMPRFAAGQMAAWLYKKRAGSIDEMTDISLANRALLAEKYEIGLQAPTAVQESVDGTKKYLFPTSGGHYVEAAYIPDGERATLCVSSQAGCRMGCSFCMTARQGFQGDLSGGDIINQVLSIAESERLTNIVYMGMGEPLDNLAQVLGSIEILTSSQGFGWSPSRITVSTVGMAGRLDEFLQKTKVHLAVSLHNPFHDQRAAIMPYENAVPVEKVVEIIRRHDFTGQRRVSFEYIVLEGLNDTPAHVAALAKLLNGLSCRINLIRFHKTEGSPYHSPGQREMEAFRDALTRKGFTTTIRASRGEDISAACGQLSTAEQERSKRN